MGRSSLACARCSLAAVQPLLALQGHRAPAACPLVKGKRLLGGDRAPGCCPPCRRHSPFQLGAWLAGCRIQPSSSWILGEGGWCFSDADRAVVRPRPRGRTRILPSCFQIKLCWEVLCPPPRPFGCPSAPGWWRNAHILLALATWCGLSTGRRPPDSELL